VSAMFLLDEAPGFDKPGSNPGIAHIIVEADKHRYVCGYLVFVVSGTNKYGEVHLYQG
jgi:hypothetical protein